MSDESWVPLDGAQHGAWLTATLSGPATLPMWAGPTGPDGFTVRYVAEINEVGSLTATTGRGYPFTGFYELFQPKDRPADWLANPASATVPVNFPQHMSSKGDYKTYVALFDCRKVVEEPPPEVPYLGATGGGSIGEKVGQLVFLREGQEIGFLPVYEAGDSLAPGRGAVNLRDGRFFVHEPDVRDYLSQADEVIIRERGNESRWQLSGAPVETLEFGTRLQSREGSPQVLTCSSDWTAVQVWQLASWE